MKNLNQIKQEIAKSLDSGISLEKENPGKIMEYLHAINIARKNGLNEELKYISEAILNYNDFQDKRENLLLEKKAEFYDILQKNGKIIIYERLEFNNKNPTYSEITKKESEIFPLIDKNEEIDRTNIIYYIHRISTRN